MEDIWSNVIFLGILASFIAGLSTAIGALPVLFTTEISRRTLDISLGFAAGVMIAASAFSLLVPALEMETGGVYIVCFGFLMGGIFIHTFETLLPLEDWIKGPKGLEKYVESEFTEIGDLKSTENGPPPFNKDKLVAIWLFVMAITVHNFPEGLAVGVAFGTGDISTGIVVALAIGMQNIPEGSAVAFPLIREGYSKRYVFGIALATGLVEPIAGAIGVISVTYAVVFLPLGMAFAAGAMIFVVADEVIPDSHSLGHARHSTFGVIFGFTLMMFLDNVIAV